MGQMTEYMKQKSAILFSATAVTLTGFFAFCLVKDIYIPR